MKSSCYVTFINFPQKIGDFFITISSQQMNFKLESFPLAPRRRLHPVVNDKNKRANHKKERLKFFLDESVEWGEKSADNYM